MTSKNFKYKNLDALNLTTDFLIDNQILNLKNTKAFALNGQFEGDMQLYKTIENELKLSTNFNFTSINIRQAFNSFNNFNQSFIESKHIKGIGSANVNLSAVWDKRMKFIKHRIAAEKDVISASEDGGESNTEYVDDDNSKGGHRTYRRADSSTTNEDVMT